MTLDVEGARAAGLKSGERARATAAARRDKFLEYFRDGFTLKEACTVMGVHYTTYRNWRLEYPDFRAQVDAIKPVHVLREVRDNQATFAEARKRYFNMNTYAHQSEMTQALDAIKPREVVMILMWPEAGKSTTLEDWTCLKVAKEPNLRMVVLSESSGLARKMVGRIKARMTDPRNFSEYITRFGPFYEEGQERNGKPWAADYFTVAGADHDERDYTLEARAITSAAYGSRIDILICDDIQSRRTYSQTAGILQHLRQTYFTRGRQMSIVIIGTRIGPGDVYERLLEEELVDRLIEIPVVKAHGDIYAPEMWVPDPDKYAQTTEGRQKMIVASTKALAKIRHQVGEEVWWASYQQQPQAPGVATFTEERIQAARDTTRLIIPSPAGSYNVASLDPALGGGCALGVGWYANPNGQPRLELLDMDYRFGLSRTEQILEMIGTAAVRYRFTKLKVEENAFQKALRNDDRLRQMSYEYGFIIEPHQTQGYNKRDPVLGVAAMAGSFTRSEILIPAGDEAARVRFEPLVVQLRAWRATVPTRLLRQDCVMMLWFMWLDWMEYRRGQQVDSRQWTTRRKLLNPMRVPLLTKRD